MKYKIVFILILLVAATLRLWGLSNAPAGLNADEAALGYNAYSLLTTGRDEHGHAWPINLESFGDFKPAGYAYMLIPFIKILGLTELAVRLPSAFFGILAVVFMYLLVKEMLDETTAIVAAGVLAVSPWHLQFSRGGWEVNVATTLMLMGVWALSRWIKTTRFWYLIFCILSFVLSMYTYQSTRLIAPVLGLGMLLLYWKDFSKNTKQTFSAGIVLLVLLVPLGISVVSSDAGSRLSGVGLLADLGPINRVNELRGHYSLANPPIYVKFLYNKVTAYSIQFVYNYLSHFDGNFLFVNGDVIARNKVPETGLLYLTDFIFVGLGVFVLFRSKNQFTPLVWLWLFVAPLAAASTFQVPHALRAQNMVIPLTILIAVGLNAVLKSRKKLIVTLIILMYLWQVARYLHEYYVHYPKEYPAAWEYGFKELVPYINSVSGQYSKIWITDKYDQPYILFLFYQKYPPELFQSHHTLTFRDKYNFSTVRDYAKFHFGVADAPPGSLVVSAPEDVPKNAIILKTINFPNNLPAFEIYEQN